MGKQRNLYLIQDDERTLYVIADNYNDALDQWMKVIREENDMNVDDTVGPPRGIQYICDRNGIILPAETPVASSTLLEGIAMLALEEENCFTCDAEGSYYADDDNGGTRFVSVCCACNGHGTIFKRKL